MAPKVLTTGPTLTDAQIDAALAKLPPVPDNVLALLKDLHRRIAALGG